MRQRRGVMAGAVALGALAIGGVLAMQPRPPGGGNATTPPRSGDEVGVDAPTVVCVQVGIANSGGQVSLLITDLHPAAWGRRRDIDFISPGGNVSLPDAFASAAENATVPTVGQVITATIPAPTLAPQVASLPYTFTAIVTVTDDTGRKAATTCWYQVLSPTIKPRFWSGVFTQVSTEDTPNAAGSFGSTITSTITLRSGGTYDGGWSWDQLADYVVTYEWHQKPKPNPALTCAENPDRTETGQGAGTIQVHIDLGGEGLHYSFLSRGSGTPPNYPTQVSSCGSASASVQNAGIGMAADGDLASQDQTTISGNKTETDPVYGYTSLSTWTFTLDPPASP